MPFHSAAAPSSLAMVAAVPSRPRYLGSAGAASPAAAAATTFFCSWSLTLAVSSGMVHICERRIIKGGWDGMVGSRRRQGNGREQVRFGGDRDPAAGEKGRRVDRRYLREACCDGTGGEAAGEGDVDLGAVVPRHGCCGVRTRRTGGGGGEETNRGMQWSAVAPAPRSQQHQASRPAGGRGWRKKKKAEAEQRRDRTPDADADGDHQSIDNKTSWSWCGASGSAFGGLAQQNFLSFFLSLPFFFQLYCSSYSAQ